MGAPVCADEKRIPTRLSLSYAVKLLEATLREQKATDDVRSAAATPVQVFRRLRHQHDPGDHCQRQHVRTTAGVYRGDARGGAGDHLARSASISAAAGNDVDPTGPVHVHRPGGAASDHRADLPAAGRHPRIRSGLVLADDAPEPDGRGITPPFGYTMFAFKGGAPDVPLSDIFGATWPFVALFVIGMLLVAMDPPLATYLPSLI